MKILLQSDNLQGVVINALLKKLPLYAETENVKVDSSFGMTGNSGADIVNVPRLILNQLRWLDLFKDSVSVAHQLIELASIMKPGVSQSVVINCSWYIITYFTSLHRKFLVLDIVYIILFSMLFSVLSGIVTCTCVVRQIIYISELV